MDTCGAHTVVHTQWCTHSGRLFIYPGISLCIFKQIIDIMPITAEVITVLVNKFLTAYILQDF